MLIENLAAGAGLKSDFVRSFARGASHAYKTYPITKRDGGEREINHPSKELKFLQRWLLLYVLPDFPVHPAAMAYQKGMSIYKNAAVHASSKYLLRMDFTKFFPSIKADDLRAYKASRPAPFNGWTHDDFNTFCMIVFRNSELTIGAPTSPAISNALCFDMDAAIEDLCAKRGVQYTRYADDLFFSTLEPNVLQPLQTVIERLVAGLKLPAHLTLNAAKTRHSSRKGARRVTGIVIGSDRKPHIGRSLKREIRGMIHRVDSLDDDARLRLSGLLGYAVGFDKKFKNDLIIKYGNERMDKARHPALK